MGVRENLVVVIGVGVGCWFLGGGDVPAGGEHSMCQVCLVLRGHRMVVVLGYRHPLGSLRPFVGTVRPDLVPSLVCPCASWLCAGGSSPSDGRT